MEYTRIQSYNNKSMTSANGRMYAGQYPFDGWVDNLESTLLIAANCFLTEGHNLKKTVVYESPTRPKSQLFRNENKV